MADEVCSTFTCIAVKLLWEILVFFVYC